MTTFSDLPPEILLKILHLIPERSLASFHTIVSISHVCAQWRSLSLDSPELWRRYVLLVGKGTRRNPEGSPAWARAKGTYLLHDALEFHDQLRSCHIESPGYSNVDVDEALALRNLQNLTAPYLQELSLRRSWGDAATVIRCPFAQDLSALECLKAQGCYIDIEISKIYNLKKLFCFTLKKVRGSHPQTPSAWIKILEQLPHLSHLFLRMPLLGEPSQDLLRPFTHRNLTTVFLDTSLPFLHSFLTHASMPRCQSLQVVVRGVNPEDPTLQSTLEQMMGRHVRPTLVHPDGGKLTIRLPDPFSVECGLSYLDSEVQDIILTLSVASERWSDPEAALWSTHALTVESALAFWLLYSTTITKLRVEASGDVPAHHEAHIAPFVHSAKSLKTLVCPRDRMEGLVGGQVQRRTDDEADGYTCDMPSLTIYANEEPLEEPEDLWTTESMRWPWQDYF
ncbi:hypothetical protein DFP72DRAFT_1058370 [Ephemerocybe angulata]|uniref:F-box domain-containing protein n=1 Tax=Ephemerocybe angulata TaxID=980116 RepID=A0A8H6IJT9_9AGAR|nr:hypothetical protein DFP72DRAFT_1058370 [Tulosesus angulatus]